MTNSEEYLEQALRLNELIEANKEQLEIIRSQSTKITSTLSERVSGSKDNKLEMLICKIMELEDAISEETTRLCQLRSDIYSRINQLDDNLEKTILIYRYIENLTFEKISEKTKCSLPTIFRIRKDAIKHFEKFL